MFKFSFSSHRRPDSLYSSISHTSQSRKTKLPVYETLLRRPNISLLYYLPSDNIHAQLEEIMFSTCGQNLRRNKFQDIVFISPPYNTFTLNWSKSCSWGMAIFLLCFCVVVWLLICFISFFVFFPFSSFLLFLFLFFACFLFHAPGSLAR